MAEVVNEWPKRRSRKMSRYDRYLDGQIWRVERGDHPSSSALFNIGAAIRAVAIRRGLKVRIAGERSGDALFVQALTTAGDK